MSEDPAQAVPSSGDRSGVPSKPSREDDDQRSRPPASDGNWKVWTLIGCLGFIAVLAICTVIGGVAYLIAGSSDDAVSPTPTMDIAEEVTPEPEPTPTIVATPTPEFTPTPEATPETTVAADPTATPAPTPTEEPESEPDPEQTPVPEQPGDGFGDGTFVVGEDIEPGLYFANDPTESCYWERLSGFSGDLDDVLANQFSGDGSRQIVLIQQTDVAFSSSQCGTWEAEPGDVRDEPSADLEDGFYLVGDELAPGTWRSEGSDGSCYWARLDGFSGDLDDILANSFGGVGDIVEVRGSDVGFESSYCGPWVRIGD